MRPNLLIIEGLKNSNSHLFDFAKQDLILTDDSLNALKDGLVFAFFGKQKDDIYKDEVKVELQFDYSGVSYFLKRKITSDNEYLLVADLQQNIDAFGDETAFKEAFANERDNDDKFFPMAIKNFDAQDFLNDIVSMPPEDFRNLYPLSIDDLYSSFTSGSSERLSLVAVLIDRYLQNTKKITDKLQNMKEKEFNLNGKLELIRDVSTDELSNLSQDISILSKELNALKDEIEKINVDLQNAEEYKTVIAFLNNAIKELEKITAKEEQIKSLNLKIAISDKTKDVYPILTKISDLKNNLSSYVTARNLAKENLDANSLKVKEGEESSKTFEKEFILNNEKLEELNKMLFSLIKDASDNPKNIALDEVINHYYADKLEDLAAIAEEKNNVELTLANLIEEYNTLEIKKDKISLTAEYKMAVNKGAFCEVKLEQLDELAKSSANIIEDLKRELETLNTKKYELDNRIKKLHGKSHETYKGILGGYKTYQEAMNAITVYKQTLYSKHLLVTSQYAEVYAIDDKIKNVQKSNIDYQNKIEELNNAVKTVLEHKEKLFIRFEYLNNRMLDLVSFNQSMDFAENTKYGEKCPFCDNSVFVKKQLSHKDTTEIAEELKKCQTALLKDDEKLDTLKTSIGEYSATLLISDQYISSLINTKNSKTALINKVLKECEVATVDELYDLLNDTIVKSNNMQMTYDSYRDIDIQHKNSIISLEELNDKIAFVQEKLDNEEKHLESLVQNIAEMLNEYGNYQSLLNGVNAVEMFPKVNVIERELEVIAAEQKHIAKMIKESLAKKTEVDAVYNTLKYKDFEISINGIKHNYQEVIEKAYADKLEVYTAEIDKISKDQDSLKLKISALKKVVSDSKIKSYENAQEYQKFNSKIEAINMVHDSLYKGIKDDFVAMGITDISSPEKYILQENIKESYKIEIENYNANLNNTIKQIQVLEEKEKELSIYNDNKALRESEKLAYLDKAENYQEAISNATIERNVLKKMQSDFIKISGEKNLLKNKVATLENLCSIITNDTILAKDLSNKVVAKADSIIYENSKGKYGLKEDEELLLINHQKDGKARIAKEFTKEENILVKLSLTSALNDVLSSLLDESFPIVLELTTEENNNILSKLIKNYANQFVLKIK